MPADPGEEEGHQCPSDRPRGLHCLSSITAERKLWKGPRVAFGGLRLVPRSHPLLPAVTSSPAACFQEVPRREACPRWQQGPAGARGLLVVHKVGAVGSARAELPLLSGIARELQSAELTSQTARRLETGNCLVLISPTLMTSDLY